MLYSYSSKLQLHWLLQPWLGTRLLTAVSFGQRCQTELCHYSSFFTDCYGRACLTFPFTCRKVFVTCNILNKAHKAMPNLTSLFDLSYSHCPRVALSCNVFSRRQAGQEQWEELWLPLWKMQWVADGRTCRFWWTWHYIDSRCWF